MGGMCLLCLYYAARLSDPDLVVYLFREALLFGLPAALIVFFQDRYLDRWSNGYRLLKEFGEWRRNAVQSNSVEPFPIVKPKRSELGIAYPRRLLEHAVEDRGEIAGVRIDYLQNLGGRGLLFEWLARLADEPCILHRDVRLISEGVDKPHLSFRERLDPRSREDNQFHISLRKLCCSGYEPRWSFSSRIDISIDDIVDGC
jgi:hypothetical protein